MSHAMGHTAPPASPVGPNGVRQDPLGQQQLPACDGHLHAVQGSTAPQEVPACNHLLPATHDGTDPQSALRGASASKQQLASEEAVCQSRSTQQQNGGATDREDAAVAPAPQQQPVASQKIEQQPQEPDDKDRVAELERLRATFLALQNNGAPESDEVVTFEDILAGAAGEQEQQAALQLLQGLPPPKQPEQVPGHEVVDPTGFDMRVGQRAATKRRKVEDWEEEPPSEKRRGAVRPPKAEAASRGRAPGGRGSGRTSQAARQPYGESPGPMPAGWVVVKKGGEDLKKQYKRYRSPDRRMFASYSQAQQYWEALGLQPVLEPPLVVVDTDLPAPTQGPIRFPAGNQPGELDDAGFKKSPEELWYNPLHSTERKYLPDTFQPDDGGGAVGQAAKGAAAGGVERSLLYQPDGTRFTSERTARKFAQRQGLELWYLPAGYDFGAMLSWMRVSAAAGADTARGGPERWQARDAAKRAAAVLIMCNRRNLQTMREQEARQQQPK